MSRPHYALRGWQVIGRMSSFRRRVPKPHPQVGKLPFPALVVIADASLGKCVDAQDDVFEAALSTAVERFGRHRRSDLKPSSRHRFDCLSRDNRRQLRTLA